MKLLFLQTFTNVNITIQKTITASLVDIHIYTYKNTKRYVKVYDNESPLILNS